MSELHTTEQLRDIIGKVSPAIDLKVIDHLDQTALHWLGQSRLMFVATGGGGDLRATIAGGESGFATGNRSILSLPIAAIDMPAAIDPGAPFASLALAKGIGETLRINGRVAGVEDGMVRVAVEECYVHCAKALIRSEFWTGGADTPPMDVAAMVDAARFVALATVDAAGKADMSPKGDPAGCMVRLRDGRLWFADRPGNRKIDSMRNIVTQPHVAGVLVAPGVRRAARFAGEAVISDDPAIRAEFTVRDRMPDIVIGVDASTLETCDSAALERSATWSGGAPAHGIDPAAAFVAHMKANRDRSAAARIASAAVSIPGVMKRGLESDYKTRLY